MDASVLPVLLTVVTAHFLALVSPGPDFMLLVKSGIRNNARHALGLPLGIACANVIYIALCIFGLGDFLMQSLTVLRIIKGAGGFFLISIAVSALRTGKEEYTRVMDTNDCPVGNKHFPREFLTGFLSGISNPKNLVFYLSLFAMVLSGDIGREVKIGLGIWMAFLVFAWDSMILLVMSRRPVRETFSGIAYYIDKGAGIIIGSLGVKLIFSAISDSRI